MAITSGFRRKPERRGRSAIHSRIKRAHSFRRRNAPPPRIRSGIQKTQGKRPAPTIPAQAGIQKTPGTRNATDGNNFWIPAQAGTTREVSNPFPHQESAFVPAQGKRPAPTIPAQAGIQKTPGARNATDGNNFWIPAQAGTTKEVSNPFPHQESAFVPAQGKRPAPTIPAQAGIQKTPGTRNATDGNNFWIPAYAGTTGGWQSIPASAESIKNPLSLEGEG